MSLYNIAKACLLLVNAVVIINERLLRQIGWMKPKDPHAGSLDNAAPPVPPTNALVSLMTDNNVKFVVHIPLIIANIVFILFETLMGLPINSMKIKIKQWKSIGTWKWTDLPESHCSICQLPFESCCQDCLLPGFGCPPVKAPYCSHWFHQHCATRWLDGKLNDDQKVCPNCRASWVHASEQTNNDDNTDMQQSNPNADQAADGNNGEMEDLPDDFFDPNVANDSSQSAGD